MSTTVETLLDRIDEAIKPFRSKGWGKLKGDITCRVIQKYLKPELKPYRCDLVGPNIYVDGCSTEFDLAVVSEGAAPMCCSAVYHPEDVRCLLEVKYNGIRVKSAELEKTWQSFRDKHEELVNKHRRIRWGYLTVEESTGVRKNAIDWLECAENVLGSNRVFCFREKHGSSKRTRPGEVQRLVQFLTEAN